MWKRKLLLGALMASSIGVIPMQASAEAGFFVDVAPPAPRVEVVPAPRAGYVWAPGYWDWRNGRHAWVRGHWERERRGMAWHPSRWEERNGRWALERGRWDKDRDGVPNRVDRDRDGDGVPNRYDRAPDNPRRQ
jgi:hypothetical protein